MPVLNVTLSSWQPGEPQSRLSGQAVCQHVLTGLFLVQLNLSGLRYALYAVKSHR
jgi:hypothetical protein